MAELLHTMLERNARKYPREEALCDPAAGIRWSWAELDTLSTRSARFLLGAGAGRGERVVLFMPNRPEFAPGFLGTLKAGGVAVPVNPRFTALELAHILKNSGAAVIVHDPALAQVAAAAVDQAGTGARALPAPDLLSGSDGGGPALPDDLTPEATAELIYTSGTTGAPKAAVLTHAAVYATSTMFAYELDIRPGDRVLDLMPMTHSAVLNLTFLGAVYAGAASVIGNYMPTLLPQLTQAEGCTHFFGAPVAYLLTAKLRNLGDFDLTTMRRWIYGGAPMYREQVLTVRKLFGPNLVGVYGLTEAGPNGTLLPIEDQLEHAGSIGRRATVNTEIRVVRPDGSQTDPGEVGEIILRTASAMTGYWQNEAATRETLRGGWIWTGDLARRDENGYMFIVDRKKDLIITGGVNVYPKEVEEVLAQHPGVEECAVVGTPHPDWGESVVAAYVPRGGQETPVRELEAFCAGRLARFKVPREFRPMQALPRNSNGKILKHVIRREFAGG